MKRTPLRRLTPLNRKAQLRTRAPLKRTGRLKPMSAKKAQEIRGSRPVVAEVFERDGGCVLRWRTDLWGPCDGPLDPHHILRQSAGGEWTREGLLTLCRIHHQWVTENPAAATAHGLSVSRLADLDEAHTLRLVFGVGAGTRPEEAS